MQQLNQLFLTAGASADLHACLFHSDFKQHIKAIDVFTRLFEGAWSSVDGDAVTRANLDLILRWMVLRFFETSPAVLAKGKLPFWATQLFLNKFQKRPNI